VDQIEEQAESPQSLMPQGLARVLSPEEFTDLIAYLETLQPGGKRSPGSQITGPIRLPPGFVVRTLVTGLTGCTAMEVLPNGDVLVAEQTGTLRLITAGRLVQQPVATLPVDSTWERGLIGVTVAPDFPQQPWIYVCYVAGKPYPHHRVSRLAVGGPPWFATSEQVLLEGDDQRQLGGKVPAGHQGGAIHFGRDGKLYVAIGDQTAEAPAQRLNTLQGKILRINADGSVPEDNPFWHKTTGKYRAIWAVGLRNPFTFAVHPASGELWINDVGGQYEEINRGVAGGNYGWPVVEHGPRHPPPYISPVYTYPQASIAGGDFCPESLEWPSEWRGRYFFADFVRGWIRALDPQRPEDVRPFGDGFHRPVDLRFDRGRQRLLVLLRDAWVIDAHFQPGTGALLEIRYAP
jgi:glucose/arabinose dehydrogenase